MYVCVRGVSTGKKDNDERVTLGQTPPRLWRACEHVSPEKVKVLSVNGGDELLFELGVGLGG